MSLGNWLKSHNIYKKSFYTSRGIKNLSWLALFATSFTATILILVLCVSLIFSIFTPGRLASKIDEDDVVPQSAIDVYANKKIINIMFYGIDSRSEKEVSRSDSIMMVTIDKEHTKIKMTSIARDTYIDIEGHGKDKVNHAFAYGWAKTKNIEDGAKLSLKTINNGFNLNVTDYVIANFWALADIIDYVGGVNIDVDEKEIADINKNYIPYLNEYGIPCEPIKTPGMQLLTGGQAVAYCRVRHVGGAVMRDGRQREVLMAMFDKAKSLSPLKYPEFIKLIMKDCTTTLTQDEITSLGMWAVANMRSVEFDTLSLPTEDIEKSGMINGVWYYTYDLDAAAKKIENFILETETK